MLALEVAEKHDQILRLKAEVNLLEENLRQANMQTHFKDDVIKELRRDYRNILVGEYVFNYYQITVLSTAVIPFAESVRYRYEAFGLRLHDTEAERLRDAEIGGRAATRAEGKRAQYVPE